MTFIYTTGNKSVGKSLKELELELWASRVMEKPANSIGKPSVRGA